MSTVFRTQRTINASPEKIWALLTDAGSYRDWNPTIVSLDGTIAAGETIKLVSTLNPQAHLRP